jgi:hypothetical protein
MLERWRGVYRITTTPKGMVSPIVGIAHFTGRATCHPGSLD